MHTEKPFAPPLRRLLWIDCLSASASGLVVFTCRGWLAPLYGLPDAVLTAMSLVSLGYAVFGYSLARAGTRARVLWLIAANLAWAVVCLAIALFHHASVSAVGVALLLFEALYVAILARLESRALQLNSE